MKRWVAVILMLGLVLLPPSVWNGAGAFGAGRAGAEGAGCCADVEKTPCGCPLCREMRERTGSCPCAPVAPQRQGGGGSELAAALTQGTVAKKVVRRGEAGRAERRREMLPAAIALGLRRPAPDAVAPTGAIVSEPPPLRTVLCVWTT